MSNANWAGRDRRAARAADQKRRGWALAIVALMGVCLVARVSGLRALPIFGDEAIYLQWAALIKAHPWANAFVSLVDPKPPLHYWLLAAAWSLVRSPLLAGRLVSVLTAVGLVPVVYALCGELRRLRHRTDTQTEGGVIGIVTCLLVVFCPYLAFYQRMALAEGLFILEAAAAACLALRWARVVYEGARGQPSASSGSGGSGARAAAWRNAAGLGTVLGVAMLTKQNVSYVLWGLPIVGLVLNHRGHREHRAEGGRAEEAARSATANQCIALEYATPGKPRMDWPFWRRGLAGLLLAGAIAAVLWCPFLLAQPARYHEEGEAARPATRASVITELKRRVFYQPQFTEPMTLARRGDLVRTNLERVFVPGYGDGGKQGEGFTPALRSPTVSTPAGTFHAPLATGWLWIYLTPLVYLASLASGVWLLARGRYRVAAFLGAWAVLMLGPLIALGTVMFSRYALAGALPLLLGAGFLAGELIEMLLTPHQPTAAGAPRPIDDQPPPWWRALLAGAILIALLAWPVADLSRQIRAWRHQTFDARDRYQYVTGWTAGQATQQAVALITALARDQKVVVITSNVSGTPADALWTYLKARPNVQVYYVDWARDEAILRPNPGVGAEGRQGQGKTYWLRDHMDTDEPARAVALPDEAIVLYVTRDPDYINNVPVFADSLVKRNTTLGDPIRLNNPDWLPGQPAEDGVVVLQLK